MGCCVLAVMIVGQMLEFWRRFKAFFGISSELYPDPYAEPVAVHAPSERLRQLLRKPAARVVFALVLAVEGTVAGVWLFTEHKDHIESGVVSLNHLFVNAERQLSDICRANTADPNTKPPR